MKIALAYLLMFCFGLFCFFLGWKEAVDFHHIDISKQSKDGKP